MNLIDILYQFMFLLKYCEQSDYLGMQFYLLLCISFISIRFRIFSYISTLNTPTKHNVLLRVSIQ